MRLLIVSDIHSNYAALRAVAAHARPYDGVAFAGDAVGYGPRPADCIAWLRQSAKWAVRGPQDDALANGTNCRTPLAFRQLAVATRRMNGERLSQFDRDYLGLLPFDRSFVFGRTRFGMVHATPPQPLYRELPGDLSDDALHAALEPMINEVDVMILGYTHQPFWRQLGRVQVVNPGSVGLPRETAPNASCAIWEDGVITLHRVPYPVGETVWDLKNAGLSAVDFQKLERVLKTGEMSPPR